MTLMAIGRRRFCRSSGWILFNRAIGAWKRAHGDFCLSSIVSMSTLIVLFAPPGCCSPAVGAVTDLQLLQQWLASDTLAKFSFSRLSFTLSSNGKRRILLWCALPGTSTCSVPFLQTSRTSVHQTGDKSDRVHRHLRRLVRWRRRHEHGETVRLGSLCNVNQTRRTKTIR